MKRLIVIAGPTASGKSQLAIQLAQKIKCPIISADSRQVYKELNIGVARPSDDELSQAEHYFIASHSIQNPLNAGQYEKEVMTLLSRLFSKHNNIILCGGTGLYIKAVTDGLDILPKSVPEIRSELNRIFEEQGISALQEILLKLDPEFYPQAEIHNHQRLIRAIEIAKISGKSNLDFRRKKLATRAFETTSYCIDIERHRLYERINNRVDEMTIKGLEYEAKNLLSYKNTEPLKTVGYSEFFDYFEGKTDYATCISLIKQNTRRYAKRQITWFKNQGDFTFIAPEELLHLF